MQKFRCSKCSKLLGKVSGEAEIKCPRCKTVNRYPFKLLDKTRHTFSGITTVMGNDGALYEEIKE